MAIVGAFGGSLVLALGGQTFTDMVAQKLLPLLEVVVL